MKTAIGLFFILISLQVAAQTDLSDPCSFPALTGWQFNLGVMNNAVSGYEVDPVKSYLGDAQAKFVRENCHGALKDESVFFDYTRRYKESCISACATMPPATLVIGSTSSDLETKATPIQLSDFKAQCHDSCIASSAAIYSYGLGLLRGAASCTNSGSTAATSNRTAR